MIEKEIIKEAKIKKVGSGYDIVHDVTGKKLGHAKDMSGAKKIRCDILKRNGFDCSDSDVGVDQSKEEVKHICPDNGIIKSHYDDVKGKCVNDGTNEYLENPNTRSKAKPNLTFPTAKHSNAYLVRNEVAKDSRDVPRKNFQGIHINMVDRADQLQTNQQNVNNRVQAKQDIKAPTKYKNQSFGDST